MLTPKKKTVADVKNIFDTMVSDLIVIEDRETANITMAQAEVDRATAERTEAINFRRGLSKLLGGQ